MCNWLERNSPWRLLYTTVVELSVLTWTWCPMRDGRKCFRDMNTAASSRKFMCARSDLRHQRPLTDRPSWIPPQPVRLASIVSTFLDRTDPIGRPNIIRVRLYPAGDSILFSALITKPSSHRCHMTIRVCALASCSGCASWCQSSRYVARRMLCLLSGASAASVHRTNTLELKDRSKGSSLLDTRNRSPGKRISDTFCEEGKSGYGDMRLSVRRRWITLCLCKSKVRN